MRDGTVCSVKLLWFPQGMVWREAYCAFLNWRCQMDLDQGDEA